MKIETQQHKLQKTVSQETELLKQAEQQKHSILIYTSYLGVLGLVIVLPIVAGAYLGRWLDSFDSGFSISWTISLIFVGVIVGAINAYTIIRGKI